MAGSPPSDFAANRSEHLRSVIVEGDPWPGLVTAAATSSPAQAFLAERDESTAQQGSPAETMTRPTVASAAVKQPPLTSHTAVKPAATVRVCFCLCTICGLGTHTGFVACAQANTGIVAASPTRHAHQQSSNVDRKPQSASDKRKVCSAEAPGSHHRSLSGKCPVLEVIVDVYAGAIGTGWTE